MKELIMIFLKQINFIHSTKDKKSIFTNLNIFQVHSNMILKKYINKIK